SLVQTVGSNVLGQHALGDVQGKDDVHPFPFYGLEFGSDLGIDQPQDEQGKADQDHDELEAGLEAGAVRGKAFEQLALGETPLGPFLPELQPQKGQDHDRDQGQEIEISRFLKLDHVLYKTFKKGMAQGPFQNQQSPCQQHPGPESFVIIVIFELFDLGFFQTVDLLIDFLQGLVVGGPEVFSIGQG